MYNIACVSRHCHTTSWFYNLVKMTHSGNPNLKAIIRFFQHSHFTFTKTNLDRSYYTEYRATVTSFYSETVVFIHLICTFKVRPQRVEICKVYFRSTNNMVYPIAIKQSFNFYFCYEFCTVWRLEMTISRGSL